MRRRRRAAVGRLLLPRRVGVVMRTRPGQAMMGTARRRVRPPRMATIAVPAGRRRAGGREGMKRRMRTTRRRRRSSSSESGRSNSSSIVVGTMGGFLGMRRRRSREGGRE